MPPSARDLIGSAPEVTAEDVALLNIYKNSTSAISRFSCNLTHNLNNLLTVTISYVERAKNLNANQHQKRGLEAALAASQRMADMLVELQEFAIHGPFIGDTCLLKHVIEEAVELTRLSTYKSINYEIDIEDGVFIDCEYIHTLKAIMNLLENAKDSVLDGGTIGVTVELMTIKDSPLGLSDGNYTVIRVWDDGMGIPEILLPRIFDPFFTTKTDAKHNGMGLGMVWGFVLRSNGAVRVRSQPKVGTSFEIIIPEGVNHPKSKQGVVVPLFKNERANVLILEDNADILAMAKSSLAEMGYDIVTAKTSDQAIDMLENFNFDLVICDIQIPGELNGSQIADRALELYPSIKVLLMSGRMNRASSSINPDHTILVKPFSMEKFAKTVQSLLK
jgi:CheY-like chemotaxis protein